MPLSIAETEGMETSAFLVQVKDKDIIEQTISSSVQSTSSSDYSDDSGNDITTDCPVHSLLQHGSDQPIPLTLPPNQEDHLSATMLMLYEQLLPTKESYDRRMGFVDKIQRILTTEWPDKDIKVHLFGSSVNDLGTSQSDVDICITTQWNGLRNVRVLAKLFRKCGMQQVVCIPRAKVPIVRLFDPEYQLACDMNVNNTLALQNTLMIRTYVAIDPRIRPLAMMIKYWAKQRALNDAANGGTLSTYTWNCMIIHFLQMRQPPILPVLHQLKGDDENELFCDDADKLRGFGEANRESLGGLLFAFFRRFAIEFDYDDQVISVRHGRYMTKREKGWHIGRNKTSLCVEEPFNVTRNLGNSADAYSVQGIRNECLRAMEMLQAGASLYDICTPYHVPLYGKTTSATAQDPNAVAYYASSVTPFASPTLSASVVSPPPPMPLLAALPPPILRTSLSSPISPTPTALLGSKSTSTRSPLSPPTAFLVPSPSMHLVTSPRLPPAAQPAMPFLTPPHHPSLSPPASAALTSPSVPLPTSPPPSHALPTSPTPTHLPPISPIPLYVTMMAHPPAYDNATKQYPYPPALIAVEPRSVETIFARYHARQPPSSPCAPPRRSSPPDWPSISSSMTMHTSSSTSTRSSPPVPLSADPASHPPHAHAHHHPSRRRRWSTSKKPDHPAIEIKLPNKERTLAEIVKLDPPTKSSRKKKH